MKKKIMLVFMVLLLVIGSVAGCGSKESEETKAVVGTFLEKKDLFSILLVISTYFVHQSALIFIPAFFLYFFRKRWWLIPLSLLMCALIYLKDYQFMQLMVDTLDSERYETYLVSDSRYSSVTLIFYAILTIFSAFNLKNYYHHDPEFSRLFLGLSILGCGLQVLASVSPSLFRLALLYTPFMMIIIPNTAFYATNGKLVRAILMSCIIFYFLYTNRHWPYSFVELW